MIKNVVNATLTVLGVLVFLFFTATLGGLLSGCDCPAPGKDGAPGVQGPAGPQGDAGAQGTAGINGTNGTSCTVRAVAPNEVAPAGGSEIICGETSTLVLNGVKGDQGDIGAQGVAGADGTVVSAIQFCSAGTSYPNTFSEVGFCIGGKLWGVYSANGGFMTELPPGTYSSNGINSSCTFTIGENCSITR